MIFLILLLMNFLAEYLLNRLMLEMNILNKKYGIYHAICAACRILWIYSCSWFNISLPISLIGLLALLFLNVIPYRNRNLLMNNFILIIYLIFTSLMMMVVGFSGMFGLDVAHATKHTSVSAFAINTTFLLFNLICFLLLRFRPEFLWKVEYDKLKVVIYTRFLLVCGMYHIFDAIILTFYKTSRINYLLLILGDIVVLILMFNFLNYNYVFAKSDIMKKTFLENEILLAQQYFEKVELKQLSELDSLTKAYNRREISSIMSDAITQGKKIVCVFADLDGLKQTNDHYGHTFGDRMLKHFAAACAGIMEGKGYLARIGGDEFLLLFIEQEVCEVEGHIKNLQSKLLEPSDDDEKISFSYGISYDEASVDDYIKSADQRMYECKNRKRRVVT